MTLTLVKAYLILLAWILTLVILSVIINIVVALNSGSTFEREYITEEFGWIENGLMILGLLLVSTFWWPLFATKTKESAQFFLLSLIVVTGLIPLTPFIINGLFWLLSGGAWDANATDSGFGITAFMLCVFIPALLVGYLVTGLAIRKRSLKRMNSVNR